jgi:hypothetical protein
MGFVAHHVIHSSVQILPGCGYGVRGYGYSVRKPNLRVTCIEPYVFV